jgi:hypothetical protein
MNPSQGLYLNRTAQHRKTRTYIQASRGIRTHDLNVRVDEEQKSLDRGTTGISKEK